MRITSLLLATLLFLPHAASAQNATGANAQAGGASVVPGPPDLQKLLLQIVREQVSFELNSVSTGATIRLRELVRQRLGDRTFVKYELIASGVEPKGLYAVMRWGLDNSLKPVFKKASILEDGTLACPSTIAALCGLDKPNDPLIINFFGAAGEALRLVLTRPDGKPLATVSITPFPLESKNNRCALSAVLLMPEAAAILIEGEGFPPNMIVPLMGDSSGEKKELPHEADARGKLQFVVLPSKLGVNTGTITIRPTTGTCHPQVTVPWGKHSYQLQ